MSGNELNASVKEAEYWALLYYMVEEPCSRDGAAYLPIFPDIHALYHTWQEAEDVRKDMINPLRYWVKRVRFASSPPPAQAEWTDGAIYAHASRKNVPDDVIKEDLSRFSAIAQAEASCEAMAKALEQIIDMNVQYATDRYGDASKAESMACVRISRDALDAYRKEKSE